MKGKMVMKKIKENREDGEELSLGIRKKELVFSLEDILKSVAILVAASCLGCIFQKVGLAEANIITVYVLAVLIISVVTVNRVYSLISSLVSVLVFNFLFTEPRFTFQAYDKEYPITFLIMFTSALLTSSLAAKLKNSAKESAQAAFRTKVLFDTSQLLQRAKNEEEILSGTADQLVKLLNREIVMYPSENGKLKTPMIFSAEGTEDGNLLLASKEKETAQWVLEHNRHGGATTPNMPDADGLYLAIRVKDTVYGVVGIAVGEYHMDVYENSILLSILGECALALENQKNAREKEEAAILAKNELYQDIYDDSMWLINLVENLLSVTRLEEGRLNLHISAELVDEVIEEALRHVNRKRSEHEITVENQDDLLLARMDAKLIVQVLINLVDNAIKYTPVGSKIQVMSRREGEWVVISVADDGPGISDMFYSGANLVADSRRSMGLGLSLCKSIVAAHGGTIRVTDHVPHGAEFTFTLPVEEVELHE